MELVKSEPELEAEPEPPEERGGGGGGVGRLVGSSQADDRRMIWLVRARPPLYARSTLPVATYHAQVKRLWREVADAMGWTVAEVRRKWSHVRNSYSRHLRNEMVGARTGRGRAVSRWYLAPELEFLRDHMATDTRPCPLSLVGPAGGGWSPSPPPPAPLPAAAPADEEDEEGAAYFQFFRGLQPDYQQLSARRRRLFRRQCLALLHRLLDDRDRDLADGSDPPSILPCSD